MLVLGTLSHAKTSQDIEGEAQKNEFRAKLSEVEQLGLSETRGA
jgi:hypothetical protein